MKPAVVSAEDGSLGLVSERWKLVPSSTGPSLPKVAVGATLATSAVKVALSQAPSLSVTVTVTV